MVRVISQGFNTPRSRHSSGEEMIDRFAAMKALSALNENEKRFMYKDKLETKTLVVDCNTDTNDSFSGLDSDEDLDTSRNEEDMESKGAHQDPTVLKKDRRRQRNKLSAQNYRQRRRVQTSAAHKTLDALASQHKILLEKVSHLEAEKHIVEEYLRNCVKIPWCPYHQTCKPINSTPPPTIPESIYETAAPGIPGPTAAIAPSRCVPLNVYMEHNNNNNMPLSVHVENNNNVPLNMHVENNNVPMSMHVGNNNNMPLSMMHLEHKNSSMYMRMSGVSTTTESAAGSLVS